MPAYHDFGEDGFTFVWWKKAVWGTCARRTKPIFNCSLISWSSKQDRIKKISEINQQGYKDTKTSLIYAVRKYSCSVVKDRDLISLGLLATFVWTARISNFSP